ncbi:hypothetical protein M5K25_025128 [Dendrobium thyrsiflorum]|uniref:Uncharacterized protein n=1 Tax=Dendrobium thyrsiflorum TaxID=117978 RepID=A0ABD0U3P3_DENTH
MIRGGCRRARRGMISFVLASHLNIDCIMDCKFHLLHFRPGDSMHLNTEDCNLGYSPQRFYLEGADKTGIYKTQYQFEIWISAFGTQFRVSISSFVICGFIPLDLTNTSHKLPYLLQLQEWPLEHNKARILHGQTRQPSFWLPEPKAQLSSIEACIKGCQSLQEPCMIFCSCCMNCTWPSPTPAHLKPTPVRIPRRLSSLSGFLRLLACRLATQTASNPALPVTAESGEPRAASTRANPAPSCVPTRCSNAPRTSRLLSPTRSARALSPRQSSHALCPAACLRGTLRSSTPNQLNLVASPTRTAPVCRCPRHANKSCLLRSRPAIPAPIIVLCMESDCVDQLGCFVVLDLKACRIRQGGGKGEIRHCSGASQRIECLSAQTGVAALRDRLNAIHEKMDKKCAVVEEMLKKLHDAQPKTTSSEAKGATNGQGSGRNPIPIRRRENQEVEILEGENGTPPLEPISREEMSSIFERMGADFEQREEAVINVGVPYSCLPWGEGGAREVEVAAKGKGGGLTVAWERRGGVRPKEEDLFPNWKLIDHKGRIKGGRRDVGQRQGWGVGAGGSGSGDGRRCWVRPIIVPRVRAIYVVLKLGDLLGKQFESILEVKYKNFSDNSMSMYFSSLKLSWNKKKVPAHFRKYGSVKTAAITVCRNYIFVILDGIAELQFTQSHAVGIQGSPLSYLQSPIEAMEQNAFKTATFRPKKKKPELSSIDRAGNQVIFE